jgi:hypothetical protein
LDSRYDKFKRDYPLTARNSLYFSLGQHLSK